MSLSDFILSSEFISALGRRVEDGSWDELAGKPSLQPSCIDTIHIIYFTPPPFFMFRHLYATVIFTFCLTVLLVLISITMSERRGVSGGVVACALRFFHSWGDVLASRAKPCQCNKVLYTVESSASPVIRLLAGSTLGEASSAVVVRLHTQCKGLHCIRGAKENLDLWSRSENKANQYSARL